MIQLIHYNKCSKSRQTFDILNEKGIDFEVRNYLEQTLNKEELISLREKLGIPLSDMIRKNESVYKELFSGKTPSDDQLLDAIVENPILLQRPIVVQGNNAVIARPPEKVLDFIV